jgi:hypothetical protein
LVVATLVAFSATTVAEVADPGAPNGYLFPFLLICYNIKTLWLSYLLLAIIGFIGTGIIILAANLFNTGVPPD